ncbi:MAG: 50S ribosomal protein L4 [Chthonomonas sp.]|nr:50S ribosomal protein L4 [Chthonomonas sp.]
MATIEIKDAKGKVVGKHDVSKTVGEVAPLMSVLHRAVVTEQNNSRQGTQSARTRSETRGGGRKPYKQKKTGNARQGTIRAPHYAHGGMAFAVKPRDYSQKLNKKERRLALMGAMNAQVTAGNVVIAETIAFAAPKTKDAIAFLQAMGVADAKRVLIILPEVDGNTHKSFRNLQNVVVRTAPAADGSVKTATFSTRDVLVAHKIVVAKDAMAKIEEVWS